MGKIGSLFALHGINQHFMQQVQFLSVKFDSLGHKILSHDLLKLIGMILLNQPLFYPASGNSNSDKFYVQLKLFMAFIAIWFKI